MNSPLEQHKVRLRGLWPLQRCAFPMVVWGPDRNLLRAHDLSS
jgi:hypothetical protein